MKYEEFKQQVQKQILQYLPESYADSEIKMHTVTKNNGTKLDGLLITNKASNIVPNIYLNSYFEEYEQGRGMNDILESMSDAYVTNAAVTDFDISNIFDYEKVKDRIVCQLVNGDRNSEYLKDKPYTRVEDLAVTYRVLLGMNAEGTYSAPVTNVLMESYGKELAELHKIAVENTEKQFPSKFTTLSDMLKEMVLPDIMENGIGEKEAMQMLEEAFPADANMYVLTNSNGLNGAAAIVNPEVQNRIAKELGEEYFVLPSSIHEVLIVRKSIGIGEEELKDMVQEVNSTMVLPEEKLSDHVYEYDADTGKLKCTDRNFEGRKKLYICCEEDKKEVFQEKINNVLGDYVDIMDSLEQAQAVYAIGQVTAEMAKEIQEGQELGLEIIHVNDKLINEQLYENAIKGQIKKEQTKAKKGPERNWGMER